MDETTAPSNLEEDQFLGMPEEVFTTVFSFIPISERSSLALVCQKFYDIICELEKDAYPLELSFQQVRLQLHCSIL